MSRPRTPIGTFGQIEFTTMPSGQVRARTRFRDVDGQLRRVEAEGLTRKAAEHALKTRLAERDDFTTGSGELTAGSSFGQLVDVWLGDSTWKGDSPRALVRCTSATCAHSFCRRSNISRCVRSRAGGPVLKQLSATKSHSKARQARTVLSLALGLAVRYDALRETRCGTPLGCRSPTRKRWP